MQVHRKNKRLRIFSNRRAFSSIVGAVFAILVIASVTGTFFVWSIAQNTRYVNTVNHMDELVAEQKSESLNFTGAPQFSVGSPGQVSVHAAMQNDGPISLTIKTLWLQDLNGSKPYGFATLNLPVSQGSSGTLEGTVSVSGAVSGDVFYGWLVTSRGTVMSLYPAHQTGPQGTTGQRGTDFNQTGNFFLYNGTDQYDARTALVAEGIGSLSFDFRSITYFTVNNGQLTPFPSGHQTYTIPADYNIALGFNVTNQNTMYNITLDSKTIMWSYFAAVPGHTLGPVWSIVSNQSATIPATYTPVELNYNQTTFVIFALQSSTFDNSQHDSLAAINLLFFGNFTRTVGGVKTAVSSYGQNVPFVSLYFSP